MHNQRRMFLGALAAGLLLVAGCSTQQAQGPVGVEVQGTLVDLCGQPVPYNTVYVPGSDPVLTDAEGHFTITGVQTPYDLVINNVYLSEFAGEGDASLLVVRGLTRTDPYLAVNPRNGSSCASASVAGTLTPASPSDITTKEAVALLLPPYRNRDFSYDDTFFTSLRFDPALAGDATLLGLRWQTDADDNAVAFSDPARSDLGAAVASVTLQDGGDVTGQTLALSPEGISTRTVTASTELSAVMSLAEVGHYVTYQGEDTRIRTGRFSIDGGTAETSFSFAAPTGSDLGSLISAEAYYGEGRGIFKSLGNTTPLDLSSIDGSVVVWRQVPSEGDAVTLSFPDPVVPYAPVSGSVVKPCETVFRWTGPEGALYDVVFGLWFPSTDQSLAVEVLTADTELAIPSYADLGGVPDANAYVWWFLQAAAGEALPTSVDEVASAAGAQTAAAMNMGYALPGASGYRFWVDAGQFSFPDTQAPGYF
ncbi:carboxypeptidase-like regulatory domain-containing protein [Oceanithermus desulfurans]|uniref:Carboxypeptidase regulatory-like domain-containing protein n=2 Tax=Oceanithermus desulfurans TaxID=227924 RepID=A0A511RKZ5_9DEIN|nr:carboxypeptidase-like regulatory domain-containing protein [Oceanithermus desulfurans]MBB6030741.1 hypothetical protein [Oceanithermus desulfurans]GEM90331.1 hypothetical protein ODE01S_17650 [Oceanithermus desulfurans NBRC 100063]